MPIRAGSTRVKVFNSGLQVYLYDEASADALRPTLTSLIGSDRDWSRAADLQRLANEGLILIYDLQGDGGVDVEILVGPPLTAAELASARWMRPQRARLRVASGKLAVHSSDTLPMGPEAPSDPGASVSVPAGDYAVTLHRLHDEQMRADGIDGSYRGPREVVVLTPGIGAVEPAPAVLPYVPEQASVSWLGRYTVEGDLLTGQVQSCDRDTITTNVDRRGAGALGLRVGADVTLQSGKLTLAAVFAGEENAADVLAHRKSAGAAGAWWWTSPDAGIDVLVFGNPKKSKLKAGAPVTVKRGAGGSGHWEAEHGVTGKVSVLSADGGMPTAATTLDARDLAAIGAVPGDELAALFGRSRDVRRSLRLFGGIREIQGAVMKFPADRVARLDDLIAAYNRLRAKDDLDSRRKLHPAWKEIDTLRRPEGTKEFPLAGCLLSHPRLPAWEVLHVFPLIVVPGVQPAWPYPAFDFDAGINLQVNLRKEK